MGRPKGGKNNYWSTEEKIRIVKRIENGEGTYNEIAAEEKVTRSLMSEWYRRHKESGIAGITNKKKPGNPLVRYSRRETLTEIEKLEYDYMKLKIENARLKIGYTEEEVMAIRRKKSSKKNTQ
ncbi:MAG: transposase [Candidatus Izemoplasmatales bacterium]|jgi:transposase-like protein|nr:transposase [Candidatus Izemoplasmatales bacterium]